MIPFFFAVVFGFALLEISRRKSDEGDSGPTPTIEPPPTPKVTKLGLSQDAVTRASDAVGDEWIYVTAQKADGEHDMAWFYFGLTSPLYVHVSASRSGVRRGKWIRVHELFDDPKVDFIDLRKAKVSYSAGYSHLNVLANGPGGQIFVDMDRDGLVTLSGPSAGLASGVVSKASLRTMVKKAFPDASALI